MWSSRCRGLAVSDQIATTTMCFGLFAWLVGACADSEAIEEPPIEAPSATRPELSALEPAVDLDPDPNVVEVHLEAISAEFDFRGDGSKTRVMAYRDAGRSGAAATVPGPHIIANVGDTLVVRFTNRMIERTTTVHWHGLRLPAEMDGNPAHSGAVYPDKSFEYRFVVRDAGLHWYHPHVTPDEQMELGLYGSLLVHGQDEPEVDVERVLVLDDIDLDDDGQVRLEADAEDIALGRHGDVILVNGGERPSLVAEAGTTERWRVVNAANGRYFALELTGHRFVVVGGDGGPLASPYETESLLIAPGERHDVLLKIDAKPGERMWLRSRAVDRGHGEIPQFDILEMRIASSDAEPRSVSPEQFTTPFAPLPVTADTPIRTFRLAENLEHSNGPRFTINDELWPFNEPIMARLGDVEVWSLENPGDGKHPFHLHGAFFHVLDRNGLPESEPAWKDTIDVDAHTTLRLAVRHETPGMWMYHCQIPEHAERGMMGDLIVAEP